MSKKKVIKAGTTRTVIEPHVLPDVNEIVDSKGASVTPLSEDSLKLDNIISADSGSIDFSSGADQQSAASSEDAGAAIAAANQQAEAVRQEAERLLTNAQQEAASVLEQAREKGYNDGMAHAEETAKEEFVPLIRSLKDAHKRISELKNVILKQNEIEIVDLALDIARKVVGAELHQNPITVASVIRAALDRIDLSEQVTVKIHPEEYEVLMRAVPDNLKDTWIVADSKVSKGGAVIETERGTFDAQIATQLEEIEKSLKKDIVPESE